jgi:hypothetical protein
VAKPHNWLDRHAAGVSASVFISFVLAGCAYIIFAKLGAIGQLYVTFVPVAAMLAYALLITLARSLRLRDDQSGDNLYYMGFLFTLTSLGVSLYQFSATRAAEEIVQNFGIAIGSTIAGIGLRVIFNQMRRDPIEVERTMRLELAEAARRVRRELDASVVEFGYFRRSAQQSAEDSFKHVSEIYDKQLTEFFSKLAEVAENVTLSAEEASRRSGATIGELSKTVGAALSASARKMSTQTEKLSGQVEAITNALDSVTSRLNAMQMPERLIEVQLEPIARLLAQAIEQIQTQSDGQAKAVTDLVAVLRGEFETTTSTNRAALESAITMINATSEVLNEITTNSKDYAEALRSMLMRTDETMRTFTEVLVKSGTETAARTEQLSEALPEIEARVQALSHAAERVSAKGHR